MIKSNSVEINYEELQNFLADKTLQSENVYILIEPFKTKENLSKYKITMYKKGNI